MGLLSIFSDRNQENMLKHRSSFVSKNTLAGYKIERLVHKQEKQPSSENNHPLQLTLAYGGFPATTTTPQNTNAKKPDNQSDKNDDGLDLGFGTLIPPPQQVNHHEPGLDTTSLIDAVGRDISIDCLLRCPRVTYGTVASLNRSFRELIRSGEIYKLRHDNKVIEYWVYFSCYFDKWEAFDPFTKKWIKLPILDGADFCYQLADKESMAVGTQLLILSKNFNGHVVYKYSLLTNSWSLGQTMKTPRRLFATASLGQVAIFAGGANATEKVVDTVELYDSRSGNWETLPSMNKKRKMCAGVYMDGKFYVIGGMGNRLESWTCGEEYDFETKTWTEIPNMCPVDSRNGWKTPPLLAVVGNELYCADSAEMGVKKYDKKRNEWEVIGRLPERAVQSGDGWGMAFRGCGDRVIVIGGPGRFVENVVEIYSWMPSKGPPEWSLIGRKSSDNFVYNCAVMGC